MSHYKNPFSNLNRKEYNVTNLKKVLDTFPTILSVKELTSTQKLKRLLELLEMKDVEIERLKAQLKSESLTSRDLDDINKEIGKLSQDLNLGELVADTAERAAREGRINALRQQGYVQIEGTPLYVNVNKGVDVNAAFRINHYNESEGFPESQLDSPTSVSFVNTSETEDVWFKKHEMWLSNDDGAELPTLPTNAFNFDKFINFHTEAVKLGSDFEKITTSVSLGYNSKSDYNDAGLYIPFFNNATSYEGQMILKVGVGSSNNIDSEEGTNIGKMILIRDKD